MISFWPRLATQRSAAPIARFIHSLCEFFCLSTSCDDDDDDNDDMNNITIKY